MEPSRGRIAVGAGALLVVVGGVHAQQAVQWSAKAGGNGHWYLGVAVQQDIRWSDAQAAAAAAGGHLATITSAAEDDFVWSIASRTELWTVVTQPAWTGAKGPWLGLKQAPGNTVPWQGWAWVTGEPFEFAAWSGGEPNDGCSPNDEDALNYLGPSPSFRRWNDFPGEVACGGWGLPRSYIVEWSADCNNDGIVDFGQIRAGELEDANGNNIPDCCEGGTACNCPADIARDGVVDGIDLAAVLNNWGSPGGTFDADVNGDGLVNGADLAEVLNSWGPCP